MSSVSQTPRTVTEHKSPLAQWCEDANEDFRRATPTSASRHERATSVFPGGDTRFMAHLEPYSLLAEQGDKAYLRDLDGRLLLDLSSPFALIHGHAHPRISQAIRDQAERGTAWNAANERAIEFAELLADRIPSFELLRFTNSGTEAAMMMCKVARAYTGRDLIVKVSPGYHGTYEGLEYDIGDDGIGRQWWRGTPNNVSSNIDAVRINDSAAASELMRRRGNEVAAVIVCPVASNGQIIPTTKTFLETLRAETTAAGALLLFDEVVTLRVARGGAQDYYGVTPDLTALGKFIGGGLPVGAFGGRADVMAVSSPAGARAFVHGGTFNGNPLTCAAGIATFELLNPVAYDHLKALGEHLATGLRKAVEPHPLFEAHAFLSMASIDVAPTALPADVTRDRLMNSLRLAFITRGILGFPLFALSTPTTDADIATAVAVAEEIFSSIPTD